MMSRAGAVGFDIFISLGISLGLTLVLELAFALIFRVRQKKELLLVCLVNIITNPAVVFLYYLAAYAGDIAQTLVLIILEVLAVVVEALFYKTYGEKIRHPVLLAVGANAFSFFVGKAVNMLVHI
ncbi:MAG: hypothetical protein GX279_03800 [Clostridiaceae bacterium]|nr:hypothetical protein [Clostridiaceae bacterium]